MLRPVVSARLSAHLFELAVALMWIVIGTAYLTNPNTTLLTSPVGRVVAEPFYIGWSSLEVLGGALTLAGILRRTDRVRMLGLCVLATGILMHGVAGVAGGLDARDLNYLVFVAACVTRAAILVHWNRDAEGPLSCPSTASATTSSTTTVTRARVAASS
jgi:hypothetical protein